MHRSHFSQTPIATAHARPLPSFWHAAVCFVGILLLIGIGLFVFHINLHVLIFFALAWAGLHTRLLGYPFPAIRSMMNTGISKALPAIYIFLLIGMVIASFMHSGTIASLLYFGLNWLNPALFLAVGFIACCLMSVATGTSWGTVGTIGVVLIGIGEVMNIPLPVVAGMIVSGATFGDKLSPISDTTNLAAMSAGTQLYRHIAVMLYTTLPTFLIVLVIFLIWGQQYSAQTLPQAQLTEIRSALAQTYRMNGVITLLPLVVMLGMSIKRYSAEISMTSSILLAVLIAVFYQEHAAADVLNALWLNTPADTGITNIDALLGRGGLYSMAWTLLLAILAVALGGILYEAGFLQALLQRLIASLHRTSTLIAATIASGLAGNLVMGEAYISIILNCQLFKQTYQTKQLDPAILSRSVEEGATLTTGIIPWTTAGVFYAATLNVPTLDYAQYALFNVLNPLISIIMAILGIGLLRPRNQYQHEHISNTKP